MENKHKRDYTKAVTWVMILAITAFIWITIYNLIF